MSLSSRSQIQIGLILTIAYLSFSWAQVDANTQVKHQVPISQGVILQQDAVEDRQPEATIVHSHQQAVGPSAIQAHAKFFQYAHVPHKDHYEIGHRKGNEHHFTERHEKAHPDAGEFKTKVRWGDKHGGYGEHYWDFNHAGHGHDHDSDDDGSERVNDYEEYDQDSNRNKRNLKLENNPIDTKSGPSLYVDEATGKIFDKMTGIEYVLKPAV